MFANLSEMLKRDPENERPRYKDRGKSAPDPLRFKRFPLKLGVKGNRLNRHGSGK